MLRSRRQHWQPRWAPRPQPWPGREAPGHSITSRPPPPGLDAGRRCLLHQAGGGPRATGRVGYTQNDRGQGPRKAIGAVNKHGTLPSTPTLLLAVFKHHEFQFRAAASTSAVPESLARDRLTVAAPPPPRKRGASPSGGPAMGVERGRGPQLASSVTTHQAATGQSCSRHEAKSRASEPGAQGGETGR